MATINITTPQIIQLVYDDELDGSQSEFFVPDIIVNSKFAVYWNGVRQKKDKDYFIDGNIMKTLFVPYNENTFLIEAIIGEI